MKIIFTFLASCFFLKGLSQNQMISAAEATSTKLSENKIYVFCRGTKSKAGIIANKYSNLDKMISHVGVGYVENHQIYIYNVTDISDNSRSALVLDSVQSFISVPDVYYFSVWEYKSMKKELVKFKALCKNYQSRKITFDYQFNIADNDTLYCSEYCSHILQKAIPSLHFKPSRILLENKFYKTFLKRNELVYFPADFFEQSNLFKKVLEAHL